MEAGADAPLPDLSLVVPMYNEGDSIDEFMEVVRGVMVELGRSWEMVVVNDGSRDNTLEKALAWREKMPQVRIIDLSRNFGKERALTAGLDATRGRAAIPLDADLQDPPSLIAEMVKLWEEGYDVVTARRSMRDEDSWLKRITARGFYRVFNAVSPTQIPYDTGDFRLMDRKVIDALLSLRERNRFMKGLFAWAGFKTTEVTFVRAARQAGSAKLNAKSLFRLAWDGITAFFSLPLRIWGYLGALISLGAFIYALFIVYDTLVHGRETPGYASLMVVMLFLGGIQLISLGVIAEYVGRTYEEAKSRPLYLIRQRWD